MNDRDMGRRPILFTDVGAKVIVGACVIEDNDGMVLVLPSSMLPSRRFMLVVAAAARPECTLVVISTITEMITTTTK